jgi:hypothetical protein
MHRVSYHLSTDLTKKLFYFTLLNIYLFLN